MSVARVEAVENFVRALQRVDVTAARSAARHFAPNIVMIRGQARIEGAAAVEEHVGLNWPLSPIFAKGVWGSPTLSDGEVLVAADFGRLGAAPRDYELRFKFDEKGLIERIEETLTFPSAKKATYGLSSGVRKAINQALAEERPMTLAYVTQTGEPSLSLRGSVQVLGNMELCAWIRNPDGGLARVARAGGRVTMLYRDSSTRTTLIIRATARLVENTALRDKIFALIPEVEQTHDPDMKGAAVVFDVVSVDGTHPDGPVMVRA